MRQPCVKKDMSFLLKDNSMVITEIFLLLFINPYCFTDIFLIFLITFFLLLMFSQSFSVNISYPLKTFYPPCTWFNVTIKVFSKVKRAITFLKKAIFGPRAIGWRPLLYSIQYSLYTVYYILYTVNCIVYTL